MTKQYNFIYQHNNDAPVYESEDGEKYIKFDYLPFRTIGEVNHYIRANSVRLNQQVVQDYKKKQDPRYLSNDDWLKLKGE